MKLSIIIPVYNVEQYLKRCLDSIFQQDVSEYMYEVIIVNDGSPDNSELIILPYLKEHSNIVYLKQANKGLSSARNVGLEKATGDYIWFIDSDDAASVDSIKSIIYFCGQYPNSDFLIFDDIHYYMDTSSQIYWKSCNERLSILFPFLKKKVYLKGLQREEATNRLKSAICQLFVYKSFLHRHNLKFVEGIIHEDDEIRLRVFFFAKEIRYINCSPYVYTMLRPGSITSLTQLPSLKSVKSWLVILKSWSTFKTKNVVSNADLRFINDFLVQIYTKLILLKLSPKGSDLYEIYMKNQISWKNEFRKVWIKSNISLISLCRYLVVLYCPGLYKYLNINGLLSLLRNK